MLTQKGHRAPLRADVSCPPLHHSVHFERRRGGLKGPGYEKRGSGLPVMFTAHKVATRSSRQSQRHARSLRSIAAHHTPVTLFLLFLRQRQRQRQRHIKTANTQPPNPSYSCSSSFFFYFNPVKKSPTTQSLQNLDSLFGPKITKNG